MPEIKTLPNLLDNVASGEKYTLVFAGSNTAALVKAVHTALPQAGKIVATEALNERLTARETLDFFAGIWGKKNQAEAAEAMGIADILDLPVHKLTPQQLKKLAAAREIMHGCPVYYIEDPLCGLCGEGEALMLDWLEGLSENTGLLAVCFAESDAASLPFPAYTLSGETLVKLDSAFVQHHFVVDKISAKQGDSVFLLNPGEIDYAESENGKTILYANSKHYTCALTLDELDTRLAKYGFYRCHRCYLVNMQKVQEVIKYTRNSYGLRLDGIKIEIPLSKGRIEEMRKLYGF